MYRYVGKYSNIEDPEVRFTNIIRDGLKNFLIAVAAYCKYNNEKFISPDFDCNKVMRHEGLTKKALKDNEFKGIVKQMIATEACVLLDDAEVVKEKRKELEIRVGTNNDELRSAFKEKLKYESEVEDILERLTWKDYIGLIRLLFIKISNPVVIFDNIDALNISIILPTLMDILIKLLNLVNRDDPLLKKIVSLPHVKFIFAVRDENIARVRRHTGEGEHVWHIKMSEENRILDSADFVKPIRTDITFIHNILNRRIKIINDKLRGNEKDLFNKFKVIFDTYWLDYAAQRGLKRTFSGMNILQFNNESISLILRLLSGSTLNILKFYLNSNVDLSVFSDNTGKLALKVRFIREFLETERMKNLADRLRHYFNKELSDGEFCHPHRMILTYLLNSNSHVSKKSAMFNKMVNNLKNDLRYSEDIIRECIIEMYSSIQLEGELITIDQPNLPENGIDDKANIRLNGKGECMIRDILINMDFFGYLLGNKYVLMELHPSKADKYCNDIFEKLVMPLCRNHMKYWRGVLGWNHRFKTGPFSTG